MEGAVVRKMILFLFRMRRFWAWTLDEVNILYYLRYIIIDYYIHFNKSEFDALEIHDVSLKVEMICPYGKTTC